MSLSILVVCTGNICRSPLAEQLLHARLLEAGVDATVRSAGTAAMVGDPMPAEAAALSVRYGGVPEGHAAVQLTAGLIEQADLVLAASREHRAAVAAMLPRAARRSYTLREFARILAFLEHDPEGDESLAAATSAREVIDVVSMSRGFATPPATPADDDVVDPWRRPVAVYEESSRVIDAAVAPIVHAFATASRLGCRVGA